MFQTTKKTSKNTAKPDFDITFLKLQNEKNKNQSDFFT